MDVGFTPEQMSKFRNWIKEKVINKGLVPGPMTAEKMVEEFPELGKTDQERMFYAKQIVKKYKSEDAEYVPSQCQYCNYAEISPKIDECMHPETNGREIPDIGKRPSWCPLAKGGDSVTFDAEKETVNVDESVKTVNGQKWVNNNSNKCTKWQSDPQQGQFARVGFCSSCDFLSMIRMEDEPDFCNYYKASIE
jgi:hypothetical protein